MKGPTPSPCTISHKQTHNLHSHQVDHSPPILQFLLKISQPPPKTLRKYSKNPLHHHILSPSQCTSHTRYSNATSSLARRTWKGRVALCLNANARGSSVS